MTDEVGTICEISPSVTKYLGISIKFVQQNQMFLQDNVKIWHLFKPDAATKLEENGAKEILTSFNNEFHTDSDTGKPVYAAKHAITELALQARRARHNGIDNSVSSRGLFDALNVEALHIEVKVKMARMMHKGVLGVRYFFIEIPDSNLSEQGNAFQLVDSSTFSGANRRNKGRLDGLSPHNPTESDLNHMVPNTRKSLYVEEASSTGSDSPSKLADLVEKDIETLIRNDSRTPKILKQI
jgi:hypothetical protein